jgi:hypothetical protein
MVFNPQAGHIPPTFDFYFLFHKFPLVYLTKQFQGVTHSADLLMHLPIAEEAQSAMAI